MTIDDFRKKIKELTWDKNIDEVFKSETSKMLQNLLSAIKNSNAFVASESNRISQFSFSSGEHLEVSIVIYQINIDECDEEDIIPKDYHLAFRRDFSDSRSDLGNNDFCYANFKFANPLFTKSVKSLDRRGLFSDFSISNGFQLYQELWCMDYLPKLLKEQGIEAKKTYIQRKGESAYITFYLSSEWFL